MGSCPETDIDSKSVPSQAISERTLTKCPGNLANCRDGDALDQLD